MEKETLIRKFQVPEEGIPVLDVMLTPLEQRLILAYPEGKDLEKEEVEKQLDRIGCKEDPEQQHREILVDRLFSRGILSKASDGKRYCLGSFYGRLDIFATDETENYDSLPRERKEQLDRWYFLAYVDSLGDSPRPTEDQVLPLDEVLEFIDSREDTPYLASCDCRRLIQNCGQPVETCITYRTAPNSFVKRGLAKAITKEEAKEIVRMADKKGLIHTINPGGICSCCTDCCYLFRAAGYRHSLGTWPRVSYQVEFDSEKCINCKLCRKRCKFSVFSQTGPIRLEDVSRCQGCGLCVTACPSGALTLRKGRS